MHAAYRSLPCAAALAAAAAPAVHAQQIIDAAFGGNPPEFTVDSGNWVADNSAAAAFNQDQLAYVAPSGTDPGSVTWNFTGLNPILTYDVAATWAVDTLPGNRSTEALYTATGATTTGPLVVSQFAAPNADHTALDSFSNAFDFQNIASLMPDAGGNITLNLADPTPGDLGFELADAVLVEIVLNGDLNADGFVGAADLDIVFQQWGDAGSPTDIDFSGTVDAGDLAIVQAQWGLGTFPAVAPEPGSLALLACAGLTLLRRRQ